MSLHNLKGSFTRAVTGLIVLGGAAIPALAAGYCMYVCMLPKWVRNFLMQPRRQTT